MTKQKCAVQRKKKYKSLLKLASGYRGRRKNCYRIAKPIVNKGLVNSYKSRKLLQRDKKSEFIIAINAAARHHGNMTYSKFINALRNSELHVKNLPLSTIRDMAIHSPKTFKSICDQLNQQQNG